LAPAPASGFGIGIDTRAGVTQHGAPRANRTVKPAGKPRTQF
jgi:hypothetical protein